MSEYFLSANIETMDKIMKWLNSLLGNTCSQGTIVKIIDWQVVPTGRPYEYSAFAWVEVKRGE